MNPIQQEYRLWWWSEMEECRGRTRNFDEITWLEFSDSLSYYLCSDKERGCSGFYDGYRNRIYIRTSDKLVKEVVGHEILQCTGI